MPPRWRPPVGRVPRPGRPRGSPSRPRAAGAPLPVLRLALTQGRQNR